MAAGSPQVSMLRHAVVGLIAVFAASGAAAQQSPPPSAASTEPPKAVVAMEEPLAGDYWTYEIRDEITGTISATRTNVVTEVTPTEISVRFKILGTSNEGLNVYDRSWNLINSGPWKYSPNDGSGVRTPLAIGKTWSFQSDDVNAGNDRALQRLPARKP
jgi:hypothetical protein